jgi:hypothetical protein
MSRYLKLTNLIQEEGKPKDLNHITRLVEKKAQTQAFARFFGFSDHGRDPDFVRLDALREVRSETDEAYMIRHR